MIDFTTPGISGGFTFQRILITLLYVIVFASGCWMFASFFRNTRFRGRFNSKEVSEEKVIFIAGFILSFLLLILSAVSSMKVHQSFRYTAILIQLVITCACFILWLFPARSISRITGSPAPFLLLGIFGGELFLRSFSSLSRFFYIVEFMMNTSLKWLTNATEFFSAIFGIFVVIVIGLSVYFSFHKTGTTRSLLSAGFTLWFIIMTPAFIRNNFHSTTGINETGLFFTWIMTTALATALITLMNLDPGRVMPRKDINNLGLAVATFILLAITLMGNLTLNP